MNELFTCDMRVLMPYFQILSNIQFKKLKKWIKRKKIVYAYCKSVMK